MLERIQKILSVRGVCSRRKAEEYIREGLVRVNGKVASIGQKCDPDIDEIDVGGDAITMREKMGYFVMHKPVGVITSNVARTGDLATSDEVTVRDLLPPRLRGKVYPVGRLDKDTSGLLLFTNDGVLAYRLTHPKFDHEKEYEVATVEQITDGQLRKIERGITIDGVRTKPAHVRRLGRMHFRLTLTEGKNRQIRRMCQKVGCPVRMLRRVRIMTLMDALLQPGQVRELTAEERDELLESVGMAHAP